MLRNIFHRQEHRAPVGTSRNQTAPSRTAGASGTTPRSRAEGAGETSGVRGGGERVERGASGNVPSTAQTTPPPPEPQGDLSAAPPPSYQVHILWLVKTPVCIHLATILISAVSGMILFSMTTGCSELLNSLR